jgi:beta-galactosidase
MKKMNVVAGFPHFLHGGDYNPDQWLSYPEVIDEDFRLMTLSGCNTFSIGIFAWSALEPEEGRFEFGWLDKIMDRMADGKFNVFLATPTGAKPPWMAYKYPETRRITKDGRREFYHTRQSHCWTSPVYREKSATINTKLAERYKGHPALKAWHISNEYHGECFCELCIASWHRWIEEKYGTLDKFNDAMWTDFWSHRFNEWSQVEPRDWVDGIRLDWLRFTNWQLCDFMAQERRILKAITPDIPATTNMMGFFNTIDYWRVAELCDFIADDSYPSWHDPLDNSEAAARIAMKNDMLRAMKGGRPFIYMESTPSATNWQKFHRLKRPGVHRLEMLQAIGHGADGTMYFQWRKSKGGCERFHGAVVDHAWGADTRVFRDVQEISSIQKKLEPVLGTSCQPDVAVIYDWEVKWAIETSNISASDKKYLDNCQGHYMPFWLAGVPVDLIESLCPFDKYRLIVAPMLYMMKPGVAERLARFVAKGGTLVMTPLSGDADEHNRCFTGERPGAGLRKLLGIRNEELDELAPGERQKLVFNNKNHLGIKGKFDVSGICEIIHCETAEPVAEFGCDFYAGHPAITVNRHGKGLALYISCTPEPEALEKTYSALLRNLGINRPIAGKIPRGVSVQSRNDGDNEYIFLLNFTGKKRKLDIGSKPCLDMISARSLKGKIELLPFASLVLRR